MAFEILKIPNAVVRETLLPNVTASEAKRESPFDELHCALKGDFV